MNWRALGASATGTTHTDFGVPCQDAQAFITEPVLCLAVSDGAGSRPMSQVGSQAAVRAVVEHVSAVDWQSEVDLEALMSAAFEGAREAMGAAASDLGLDLRDVAATLGVVIDSPAGRCVGQVGDCLVFLRSGGVLSVVAPPPRHEFANVTEFLTDPAWQDWYRYTDCSALVADGWAASTDGLRYKILASIDPAVAYEPFFEDLFAYCLRDGATSESIGGFLDGLGNAQTGDDKTLVVAVAEGVAVPDVVTVAEGVPVPDAAAIPGGEAVAEDVADPEDLALECAAVTEDQALPEDVAVAKDLAVTEDPAFPDTSSPDTLSDP